MKLTAIFLSAITILLASCSNSSQDPEVKDSADKDPVIVKTTMRCYRYINNNDTVILKLMDTDGRIGGTLMYNLFEKDKNTGTIIGEMKGDMLIAEYSFHAEGMESVRAVAFKKMGKNFIEGYGESEEINGKDVFKNIDSLSFTNSIMLSPYDCEK
jgi:hypothetical protein